MGKADELGPRTRQSHIRGLSLSFSLDNINHHKLSIYSLYLQSLSNAMSLETQRGCVTLRGEALEEVTAGGYILK